jgi:predicted outer membrane protein
MQRYMVLAAVMLASATTNLSAQYTFGPVLPRPLYSDSHDFLIRLTIVARSQVELGSMALQKATRPDVTAFARMMLTDYTRIDTELSALATDMNIGARSIDDEHRIRERRLDRLYGREFEREYIQAMFIVTQEVVSMLRIWSIETSKRAADDPLARWGNDMLPKAEEYLEKIRQLQQTVR